MEDHWDERIVKQWNEQDEKSGLNVSVLKPKTKMIVETRNSFYEFDVIEGKLVSVFGGTCKDGNTRYVKPIKAIIHGSTWGGSLLKIDWIGIDMHLEFHEQGTNRLLTTSPIKNITVEAPNGEWSYMLN